MIEKPMLFSARMVKAILDGRKTQTRRIVKPQPPFGCSYTINGNFSHALCFQTEYPPDSAEAVWVPPTAKSKDHRLPCPHPVGSRIWVKETYRLSTSDDCACYEPCSCKSGEPIYRASLDCSDSKWKPSIFMPRKYSRIDLEVTAVRVERLQEISETDAIAEGLFSSGFAAGVCHPHAQENCRRCGYQILWQSINGKGSWALNPFVWCYTFKRVKP